MTIVTNRIQSLRKAYHCKQQDLADSVGVTRRTMSRIEHGDTEPSFGLAWQIARYFDLPVDEVFAVEQS